MVLVLCIPGFWRNVCEAKQGLLSPIAATNRVVLGLSQGVACALTQLFYRKVSLD